MISHIDLLFRWKGARADWMFYIKYRCDLNQTK